LWRVGVVVAVVMVGHPVKVAVVGQVAIALEQD
jgi:hypothetical protein